MSREIRIIAVDFDGTLCTECYPAIGLPNLRLISLLKELRIQGRQVILWTCRCGERLEEAVDWCRGFGLEFDAVNANVRETLVRYGTDARKISADVYIDDRSCGPWICTGKEQSSEKFVIFEQNQPVGKGRTGELFVEKCQF